MDSKTSKPNAKDTVPKFKSVKLRDERDNLIQYAFTEFSSCTKMQTRTANKVVITNNSKYSNIQCYYNLQTYPDTEICICYKICIMYIYNHIQDRN